MGLTGLTDLSGGCMTVNWCWLRVGVSGWRWLEMAGDGWDREQLEMVDTSWG